MMSEKNNRVFGIYTDQTSIEYAVSALKVGGIRDNNISLLLQENLSTKNIAHEKAARDQEAAATRVDSRKILRGPLEWFAATGALIALGRKTFLIAGPIVSTLAEVAIGGRLDGLSQALIALGQPEYEAKRYHARIENGGILLLVHCKDPACTNKVKHLLTSTGAEDISTAEAAANY
jgi:hypothetical protein